MITNLALKTKKGTIIYNMYIIVYNWIKLFVYLYNKKIRNTAIFKFGGEVVLR